MTLRLHEHCTINMIQLLYDEDHEIELYNSIMVWSPDQYWREPFSSYDFASRLYYASTLGLFEVCERLIETGVNVNAQGGYFGNSLQAASLVGQEGVVRLLLV